MPFGESPVAVTSGCQAGDVSSEAPPSGPLTAGKRTACRGTHADLTLRPPPGWDTHLGPGWDTHLDPHPRWDTHVDLALRPRVGDLALGRPPRRRLDDVVWTPTLRRLCAVWTPTSRAVDGGRWMEGGGWDTHLFDGCLEHPPDPRGRNRHPTRLTEWTHWPDRPGSLAGHPPRFSFGTPISTLQPAQSQLSS